MGTAPPPRMHLGIARFTLGRARPACICLTLRQSLRLARTFIQAKWVRRSVDLSPKCQLHGNVRQLASYLGDQAPGMMVRCT